MALSTGRGPSGETIRIVHVTTVSMTLRFFTAQMRHLMLSGVDVTAISSPGAELADLAAREGITARGIPMSREITPARDLLALFRMWRFLRRTKPHVVHAHTPKGGLLGIVAAWLAGVPVRVYTVHGLPLMTARGAKRRLLAGAERVSCALAHRVLCVSDSLRREVRSERLCDPEKIAVLGCGSAAGVEADDRFDPSRFAAGETLGVRARLGIPADALVVGFVGRLVGDKGLGELAEAWRSLRGRFDRAHLLVVGPAERRDPLPPDVEALFRSDARIHLIGPQWDTPPLYAAMDVVCLPSHREGFGMVLLEAAAMNRPVVATSVAGCVDAVEAGVTGLLVPPRDATALGRALAAYLDDPALRAAHGAAGRVRALRHFRAETMSALVTAEYLRLLERRFRVQPSPPRIVGLRPSPAATRAKRAVDVVIASILGALGAPLAVLIAIAVRLQLGSPVLFRQQRAGQHGRPFRLVKFRTMTDARGADGTLLPDEARLTTLGRLLRATSLDELPELWNVLRGEMSLVGPRPLFLEYLPRYTPEQARRHEVKPGLTGWAQINGRNAVSWDEKFRMDVWYVDNRSLALDLKILLRTPAKVLQREGVSQPGRATVDYFHGNG